MGKDIPKKPDSTVGEVPLGAATEAQLIAQLARLRAQGGKLKLSEMELAAESSKFQFGRESLEAMIEVLPPETDEAKPCPKCGKPISVRARRRERQVLTLSGPITFVRNYHYCEHCEEGFYPRDAELGLPEEGDVSEEMSKRILDLGVNDTFAAAAERFSIHYPQEISENLVRRVVDRVGRMCEHADPLLLQESSMPTQEPASFLVVATDGSMLQTREDAWREAKVAVVARGENHVTTGVGKRPGVLHARYVAVLESREKYIAKLKAALAAERADEVTKVVWLADGASGNWTLAKDSLPFAIQILDHPHAVQHGMACGRILLGEDSECLELWERRIRELLEEGPQRLIEEIMDCLPETDSDEELGALDDLVRYYRTNETRMHYAEYRADGLPIGSGIAESAHKHVLQVRMKRAGQRWGVRQADQMAGLRAAYRTAGPRRFHWAIREAHHRTRLRRSS